MSNTILGVKLTKQFFLTVPAGAFLVSNCMTSREQSIFEEVLAPMPDRQQQWARIVAVGAGQRMCRVFRTAVEYKAWLATLLASEHY